VATPPVHPNVTRWAPHVEAAWEELGRHAPSYVPLTLGQIHKESLGNPAARNKSSNAIGLGQQFIYIDGKHYRPKSPPWTHPDGAIMGFPVTWDPEDQIMATAGLVNHHLKRNTDGHLPTAAWAYASGPGNVQKVLDGESGKPGFEDPQVALTHLNTYLPNLSKKWDDYSAWYTGWIKAGRPRSFGSVKSGDGKTYRYNFAKHDVRQGPRMRSPFDGQIIWRGQQAELGPNGPSGGVDPKTLKPTGLLSGLRTGRGTTIVVSVVAGLAVGGSVLYALSEDEGGR
jgi:hypothetical protein